MLATRPQVSVSGVATELVLRSQEGTQPVLPAMRSQAKGIGAVSWRVSPDEIYEAATTDREHFNSLLTAYAFQQHFPGPPTEPPWEVLEEQADFAFKCELLVTSESHASEPALNQYCYCVCHSPYSSCAYCRHCKGDNEVIEWHRIKEEAEAAGHKELVELHAVATELAAALATQNVHDMQDALAQARGIGLLP